MSTYDVFYPGLVDDTTQTKLREMPRDMWGLVTGIVSGTNKMLRVSKVEIGDFNHKITFSSPSGFPVMLLAIKHVYSTAKAEASVAVRNVCSDAWSVLIVSTNFKYLLKNLLADNTNKAAPARKRAVSMTHVGNNLMEFVQECERLTKSVLRRCLTEFRDNVFSKYTSSRRSVDLPVEIMGDVCRAIFGDKSLHSLQPETLKVMKEMHEHTKDVAQKTDNYVQVLRDMFCRDKWVIGYSPDKELPVIVYSVNLTEFVERSLAGGDKSMSNVPARLSDYEAGFISQPHAYTSIQAMGEQERNALQSSLTFLKVANGSGIRYPSMPSSDDPDMLLPLEVSCNPDAGAISFRQWGGPVRGWLMVDK